MRPIPSWAQGVQITCIRNLCAGNNGDEARALSALMRDLSTHHGVAPPTSAANWPLTGGSSLAKHGREAPRPSLVIIGRSDGIVELWDASLPTAPAATARAGLALLCELDIVSALTMPAENLAISCVSLCCRSRVLCAGLDGGECVVFSLPGYVAQHAHVEPAGTDAADSARTDAPDSAGTDASIEAVDNDVDGGSVLSDKGADEAVPYRENDGEQAGPAPLDATSFTPALLFCVGSELLPAHSHAIRHIAIASAVQKVVVADAEGNVSVTHMESHDNEMLALPAAPSDRRKKKGRESYTLPSVTSMSTTYVERGAAPVDGVFPETSVSLGGTPSHCFWSERRGAVCASSTSPCLNCAPSF